MKVRGHSSRVGFLFYFLYVLCFLNFPFPTRADELKLKDGTKIAGTIVGYEGDSFKVETTYGFALVRKDKIASITFSDDKKADAAKRAAAKEGAGAAGLSPAVTPAAGNAGSGASPAPTASRAASPPAELPMREAVEGNHYVNHTYAFRMYKPPSWRVLEDARKLLPAAIVAMGTEDESTLLVLGRSPLRTTLDAHIAATERELRSIYENFQLADAERSVIAGVPAVQRRFQGTAENRHWSGVFISIGRGPDVITILGMTSADSDLIQIQENLIARAVASLEFLK